MEALGSTIIGGLIAAGSGAATTIIADWLGRRRKREESQAETLIEWAAAFERWLSLYHDYAGLVLSKPEPTPEPWKEVFIRRMEEAGEAGRRLDIAKNSVLIVERETWVREEVVRLTRASEVRFNTSSSDPRMQASDFRAATEKHRNDLVHFLDRYASLHT